MFGHLKGSRVVPAVLFTGAEQGSHRARHCDFGPQSTENGRHPPRYLPFLQKQAHKKAWRKTLRFPARPLGTYWTASFCSIHTKPQINVDLRQEKNLY